MTKERPWLDSYLPGVPATVKTDTHSSLPAFFASIAKAYPSSPAYTNMGSSVTFAQVDRMISDFAAYLQSVPGLAKGDRVAIMMPNLIQYFPVMFGTQRAGMVVVNVNPMYTPRELLHMLRDSSAKVIVVLENFARTVQKVLQDNPDIHLHVITTRVGDMMPVPKRWLINFAVKHVAKMVKPFEIAGKVGLLEALAAGHARGFKPVEVCQEDPAFLQYTGGTTGVAKGAILLHRNILANIAQMTPWIASGFKPTQETALGALPLYHVFALTASLVFTQYAFNTVLITDPRKMDDLVKQVRDQRISILVGVNTLFNAMLRNETFQKLDFKRIHLTIGGGASVQKVVSDRWREMTGTSLLEAYGLTECSPGVSAGNLGSEWNGTVGLPFPSTDVSIRNENFEDLGYWTDPSQIEACTGEICVRGPQVMAGYWNRPEETANVLRDGWLRTGDVGHMNSKGEITITDRKKDLILVSGFNVYPNEVEGVIASMPEVLEVGVVGVPRGKSGEMVKAVIVRKDPTLTAEAVEKYCRTQLTGYKIPRQIVFVDSLPKTAVGKILRRELKDLS